MKRTGGNWDPLEEPCYFIASNPLLLQVGAKVHQYILVAVNELNDGANIDALRKLARSGIRVFVDSGVFNLTNEHAREHGVSMDVALGLAPSEIDGFDDLFRKYCDLIRHLGDDVWGYIEVDQGGKDNKRATRARLEGLGFKPIPVYHPLNDGWDYFDELAGQYDRICLGNVVQADVPTRKRLIATAWERKRQYPHLWIHALGLTPADWFTAFPLNSCDSSSWLTLIRWTASYRVNIANKRCWGVEDGLTYELGQSMHETDNPDEEMAHRKVAKLGAYDAHFTMLSLRNMVSNYRDELGCDTAMAVQT